MTAPRDRLSPRMRACLELVWTKQATSKEIAAELGISKLTVDGYIAEAVELLGARDRREAAAMVFGGTPRSPLIVSGGDPARVSPAASIVADDPRSTGALVMARPWRSRQNPRNSLLFGQTIAWIAMIAIGSLAALALATSVGNGLPQVAKPIIEGVRRLTP